MSVFLMLSVYLGIIFVIKPWKLLSKPDTEEEKKERLKRLKDFVFITGYFMIMTFFFTPFVRHYFLEELGWSSITLCALNVFVIAIFIVALVLWERNTNKL